MSNSSGREQQGGLPSPLPLPSPYPRQHLFSVYMHTPPSYDVPYDSSR